MKLDNIRASGGIVKLLKKIPARFSLWDIISLNEETTHAVIVAAHYEIYFTAMQLGTTITLSEEDSHP